MSEAKVIATIALASAKNGVISVTHIDNPYGEGTKSVVSVGVTLKGEGHEPDWKAHIPYENLDDVIAALREAKAKFGS